MLFWAFFEQAGSSHEQLHRPQREPRLRGAHDHGRRSRARRSASSPPRSSSATTTASDLFTLDVLDKLRKEHKDNPDFADRLDGRRRTTWAWGSPSGSRRSRPAPSSRSTRSTSWSSGWSSRPSGRFLANRGLEPSTPVKFALGLLQLGLGFAAFWYGAQTADQRGMVALGWLLLGYLLHTTGELCLSPVGLSMVTKLSPGPAGEHGHGHVVPGHGVFPVPRRHHRPVHRRDARRRRGRRPPFPSPRKRSTSTATCSARSRSAPSSPR